MSRLYWHKYQLILVLLLGCAACHAPTPNHPPTNTPSLGITPYWTPTPSRTLLPPTTVATIPVTPAPTATPFLHTIKKDDTMLAIAAKYGISLEELLAANPGVDPNFLTIGKTLVIPLKGQDLTVIPSSTPLPLEIAPPNCYMTADGGAWCFVVASNKLSQALENLTAWIGLFSPQGDLLASQTAIGLLNLLPGGQAMPLVAFFPPPLMPGFSTRAELLTAVSVSAEEGRYLETQLRIQETNISSDGREATLKGKVGLPQEKPANTLWVLAVAYDAENQVVGMRKWEAGIEGICAGFAATATAFSTSSPKAGQSQSWQGLAKECLSFEFTVYSLGPTIARLDVLVEARP